MHQFGGDFSSLETVPMKIAPFLLFLVAASFTACSPAAANDPNHPAAQVSTFEECVAAGGTVTRAYPPRCVTADGKTFGKGSDMIKAFPGLDRPLEEPKGKACEDRCGDGTCQEIVCMAIGCPCAETAATCPQDCKS